MLESITTLLTTFSGWLGQTSTSNVVASVAWIVPATQTVHILAVSTVVAAVAIINLRTLGIVDGDQPLTDVLDRYLPAIAIAIPILAVTGLILIAGEPTRAIFRAVFWIKMALLVAAGLITFSLRRDAATSAGTAPRTLLLRTKAVISTVLWFGVVVEGRWIGYAVGWDGAPA